MMNCELLTTCSALGYLEEEEYYKEPDCAGNMQVYSNGIFFLFLFQRVLYSIL